MLPATAFAQPAETLPAINVTASRLYDTIVGTSTTIITSEDIASAPQLTIQEIIAQAPGVQLQSLYGGVNGVGTSVDLRGFGAFATANTLVLINGRRLNDIDLAGVDLSTLPRQSIERIEITRGNSAAVLYGDNVVGGVINIVTKTGAGGPPVSLRAEGGAGSYGQREGNIALTTNSGAFSSSLFANGVASNGYRDNNNLKQGNAVGEIRYTGVDFTSFLNLSADDQRIGLPGARRVSPTVNELETDRRGASTPYDYAAKQGLNATAGFTYRLWSDATLIVDGGVRNKKQQAGFFSPFAESYVDSRLTTWSITPRLDIRNDLFGLSSKILTGIDYYDATYNSDRSQFSGLAPIHAYHLTQRSVAGYWQQTIGLLPSTDFSYGGRIQSTSLSARDKFDPLAPGAFDAEHTPLDTTETNHALHVGLEHRFNDVVTVFGRAARSFRTPNVDERLATGPGFDSNFNPIPQTFQLKTQTSYDVEGGVRIRYGAFNLQTTVYNMDLTNEIHFDPVNFYNYNLDPTRRFGSETQASYRISETLRLTGSFTYTDATFRDGPYAGNEVPLVSRYTASGGVRWNAWQNYLVVDASVRYWSSRRMDNDQPNTQPMIPADATVDLKVSGAYEKFFWSFSINNLFDRYYYDYAVASAYSANTFNAYPLPGRTFLFKAGFQL